MSKIIGQDKLIKEVNRIFQVFVNSNCKIRPHFILTGESGSGKSFTIKQLCDMNEHYGYLVFKKERNLETGRIESFEIEESKNCYYSTFVFIDDLCDAGGTFLGELKVLKERYPNSKFIIIVCHAVNDKGLVNMCNNFDQVIVSNSHRDINYRPSNENLTVIDVCK